MPYKTTWEGKGIYWKATGDVTTKEIISLSNELNGSPLFDDAKYYIFDGEEVEKFIHNTEYDTERIAAEDVVASSYKSRLKGALVGTLPELITFFNLYIETINRIAPDFGWQIKIFSSVEEARNWISEDINKKG